MLTLPLQPGGTPTATAISTVFYYLSRNPSAYAQLASEVRTTFASGGEIRHGQQLTSSKFLRAVIDESLSICPPTPGVMWREKDPLSCEPLVVDGRVIPPGALVGVGVYSLMHKNTFLGRSLSAPSGGWRETMIPRRRKREQPCDVPSSRLSSETELVRARLWHTWKSA